MPRAIWIGKVVTAPVRATRTIVPGDSFADIYMFLALMAALDEVESMFPALHIMS